MRALPFFVLAASIPACDKGDDSAAAGESDTDTDSDTDSDMDTDSDTDTATDSDTDTDTDTDSDTDTDTDSDADTDTDSDTDVDSGLTGTIELDVVDADGVVLCDTTFTLTGTEYTGSCPSCEFAYQVDSTVASEAGADCEYELYWMFGTFLQTKLTGPDVYLAFSPTYDPSMPNALLQGLVLGGGGAPSVWAPIVYDGSIFGLASYAKGTLSWTLAVDYPSLDYSWDVTYCSSYKGGTHYAYRGGAYAETASIPCETYTNYDRWTFQAATDDHVFITINTIDAKTTFDPQIGITDSTSCYLGGAFNGFSCTYPPSSGNCPSYELEVSKGELYNVLVYSKGSCASTDGEYEILIDASADPSLTLANDDAALTSALRIDVVGTAYVP